MRHTSIGQRSYCKRDYEIRNFYTRGSIKKLRRPNTFFDHFFTSQAHKVLSLYELLWTWTYLLKVLRTDYFLTFDDTLSNPDHYINGSSEVIFMHQIQCSLYIAEQFTFSLCRPIKTIAVELAVTKKNTLCFQLHLRCIRLIATLILCVSTEVIIITL